MAGLTSKTPAATYKDLLKIENSNSGVDDTLRQVESGDGTGSALHIEKNSVRIKPTSNDTALLDVQNKDGSTKFKVDVSNNLVYALGHKLNTQYVYFGIESVESSAFSTNHYPIPFMRSSVASSTGFHLNSGTDPATSYTISSTGDDIVNRLWYPMDDLTIATATVWVGADASSGDTIRFHLMQYDIDVSNGSTGGDLSNGVVLADGADITNSGYEQAYTQDLTIQSADVSRGKAVFFTFKSDSTSSDYTINAAVKYHLR